MYFLLAQTPYLCPLLFGYRLSRLCEITNVFKYSIKKDKTRLKYRLIAFFYCYFSISFECIGYSLREKDFCLSFMEM